MNRPETKTRIAVHKFSSCDGCQLALINHVAELLKLSQRIEIVHFAEAGPCDPEAPVDIAFVEGSVSTSEDDHRLDQIREQSQKLVTIGACATSGGLQALRNMADHEQWRRAIYAKPEFIDSLAKSTPIRDHVKVDHEIWGCPVNHQQLFRAINSWLMSSEPEPVYDTVCSQCKARENNCIMVNQGKDCLGPVTLAGCGALCPSFNRGCYGCFGPAQFSNTTSLAEKFSMMGLSTQQIAQRFLGINSQSPAFFNTAQAPMADEQ